MTCYSFPDIGVLLVLKVLYNHTNIIFFTKCMDTDFAISMVGGFFCLLVAWFVGLFVFFPICSGEFKNALAVLLQFFRFSVESIFAIAEYINHSNTEYACLEGTYKDH